MEELRTKLEEWYNKNYESNDDIEDKDYFCPLIKEMCLGDSCALWNEDFDRYSISLIPKCINDLEETISKK